MANIVLDYAVKFNQIGSLPVPSTDFLHSICIVSPLDGTGTETGLVEIDKTELDTALPTYADQVIGVFDGGLNKITIAYVDDITDLPDLLDEQETEFYTVFALPVFSTSDFLDNSTSWPGVRGFVTNADTDKQFVILPNTCGFFHQGGTPLNAYNPLRAFGELLSASLWRNQQYVQSTETDGTATTLGGAELLFADRFSFWISDQTTGIVLGFFVAGGQSITTPYIVKELELRMQTDMSNYLAVNQPFNTTISRNQLERIGKKRITQFIELSYLDPDEVNDLDVTESNEIFVVNGQLTTSPAVALWRVFVDSAQTQG